MSITTLNENRQVPSVPVPSRHANPSLDAIVELGTTMTFLEHLTGALQKLPKALAKAVAAMNALEQNEARSHGQDEEHKDEIDEGDRESTGIRMIEKALEVLDQHQHI